MLKVTNVNRAPSFRTAYDAKGYLSVEECPDKNLVTQEYEPIALLVKRMQRGELVQRREDAYYESDTLERDNLLDDMNPTESPDFDLADASALLGSMQKGADAPTGGKTPVERADASGAPVGAEESPPPTP